MHLPHTPKRETEMRAFRIIRAAFDEGVFVAGMAGTAFGGALLAEGLLVALLGR